MSLTSKPELHTLFWTMTMSTHPLRSNYIV